MSVSTSPSHRCPVCKSTPMNARNLAVFIDGTSNQPGDEETNVFKLFNLVSVQDDSESKLEQRKYYLKGVGAHDLDNLWEKVSSIPEMAIARDVKKNVMEAYTWLVETYHKGDQIYLFGFSRGAYQVRALAGMIHEVGLLDEKNMDQIKTAYYLYRSIDPNKPETRNAGIKFKKAFCRQGVRIHFVGVWDTVSSLGLIKQDVHVTASASVTNTCHFRHALALDEFRVKFIPEYFSEMNAHCVNIRSQRSTDSDVKEVWFAGCHSDVGGISRPRSSVIPNLVVDERRPVHADNVPLLWMRREADAKGLVFKSERFAWHPGDVDLWRKDPELWWKFFEILPVRHQISFSGTGKHERRWHLSRPRLVIPRQRIHSSVSLGDVYTPRATLGYGVHIPTLPQMASGGLWTHELLDEGATLTSLLSDPQETLKYLGEVLLLLHLRLDNGQAIPSPQWDETPIRGLTGFDDKFALSVIYDVTSNISISEELVGDVRSLLCTRLSSHENQGIDITRTLYILQFSIRHQTPRRRFIANEELIEALIHALKRTTECRSENLFPLVMDSLCYLIDDNDQRDNVISKLASSDGTKTRKTRLSSVLKVKAPGHLKASLKMLASLARYRPDLCKDLKPRIIDLAKNGCNPVGLAAVEALVALQEPQVTRDVRFSTILGYLNDTLPQLDAEVGSTYSPRNFGDLPPVLRVNGSEEKLDKEIMHKLLQSVESSCVDRRTRATLTLLKLCNNSIIRDFCSHNKVSDIFMRQMARKETSLLAAYVLKTCLKDYQWTPRDFNFRRAAQLIVAMFDKGWFDDAVGRVEGSEIFRELVTSDDLRHRVINFGIVNTMVKKFEGGESHEVRMSLIYLEILGRANPMELTDIVNDSLDLLRNKSKNDQKRGVKILSALARTVAGERAIVPHLTGIVNMLLNRPPLPRSQLEAPTAALYDLCRNETLREKIKASGEFSTLADRHRAGTL